LNDHTFVEKCIVESKSSEEQEPADKVMEQMEFIGTKITEVSTDFHIRQPEGVSLHKLCLI